jgi:hypothetical protein
MKRFVLAQNPLKGFPLDKVYRVPLKKEVLMQLYPTHDTYVKKVQESVEALVRERLIIQEDGLKIIKEAEQASVP